MIAPFREPRTMAELDALSPAERRAYWHRQRRRMQLAHLAELASDYARDVREEVENQQDYTAHYRNTST